MHQLRSATRSRHPRASVLIAFMIRVTALSALMVPLLAGVVAATTIRLMDFAQLCESSPRIVTGRVVAVRGAWTEDHRSIITWVTVETTAELKGSGDGTVTVAVPGGTVDACRVIADGAPSFAVGEEAVFFFNEASPSGVRTVSGLSQGKFDIVTDPDTGERLVQRMTPGMAFRDLRTLRLAAKPEQQARITYDEFLRQVSAQLGAGGDR